MTLDKLTTERAKWGLALAAAWGFGLWSGINYTAQKAPTTYRFRPPEWVAPVKSMEYASIVVFALCVAGWIVLDYRETAEKTECGGEQP